MKPKSKSLRKQISELARLLTPMVTGSKKMTKRDRHDTIYYKLYDLKWNLLGQGSYASVLGNNNYPRLVIKVLLEDDRPYTAYAKFCMAYARKHKELPRIYKKIQISKYQSVYILERLKSIHSYEFNVAKLINRINLTFHRTFKDLWLRDPLCKKEMTGISKILKKIPRSLKQCTPDIHQGNIMMRGKTVVLSDIFC